MKALILSLKKKSKLFTSSNELDSRDQSVTKALSSKGKKQMAFALKWNFHVEI